MVLIAVLMFHPQSFISSDCVEHLNFFTCSCCVPLSILHIFSPMEHLNVPNTAVVVFQFQSFTPSGLMEHLDVPSTAVVVFHFQSFTSSGCVEHLDFLNSMNDIDTESFQPFEEKMGASSFKSLTEIPMASAMEDDFHLEEKVNWAGACSCDIIFFH